MLAITCSLLACGAKPSEKSFEKAYDGMIDDTIDGLDAYYEKLGKYDPSNATVEYDISVELSDELLSMLRSMTAEDFAWLNDLNIGYMQTWKDEKLAMDLGLDYNGKELISGKAIMDLVAGDMYMAIPVLNSKYIKLGSDMGVDMSALSVLTNLDYTKIIPEQKVLENVIKRYYGIIMDNIGDVEYSETTLKVNGVSQDCVEYVVELSEKEIFAIVLNVLETIKDDEDIKDMLVSLFEYTEDMYGEDLGVSADEAYAEFVEGVESAIDDMLLSEGDLSNDTVLTWTSYITDKLDVLGAKIELVDEDGEVFTEINFAQAQNKEDIGVEISVSEYGYELLSIEGELTNDGKVLEGTYELTVDGQSILFVDLEDVDVKKLDKGYFNGSISIAPSKGLIDMIGADADMAMAGLTLATMSLKFDIEQENDTDGKVTMSLMSGKSPYASITVAVSMSEGQNVTIPSANEAMSDPEEWARYMNLGDLLDNLSESGLPDYVVEMIELYLFG